MGGPEEVGRGEIRGPAGTVHRARYKIRAPGSTPEIPRVRAAAPRPGGRGSGTEAHGPGKKGVAGHKLGHPFGVVAMVAKLCLA